MSRSTGSAWRHSSTMSARSRCPDAILDKPAPLTSAEWRSVVQHPRIGQVILEHAAALRDAVPIILHHHERFAGHGYPYGLRANEIPLGARIVAIADAYDAMTHDRPYKRAMSHDAAIVELQQHAGTQFDPELVALFCDLYTNRAPTPDPTILAITNPQPQPTRSSGESAGCARPTSRRARWRRTATGVWTSASSRRHVVRRPTRATDREPTSTGSLPADGSRVRLAGRPGSDKRPFIPRYVAGERRLLASSVPAGPPGSAGPADPPTRQGPGPPGPAANLDPVACPMIGG